MVPILQGETGSYVKGKNSYKMFECEIHFNKSPCLSVTIVIVFCEVYFDLF